MDDQPVWLTTRGGRILSVPYPQELNDIPRSSRRKDTAADFADMIVDQFDEMLEQAASSRWCMGIALHAYIVGQPFRLRHLRRALRHILDHGSTVWVTDTDRIAAAWSDGRMGETGSGS